MRRLIKFGGTSIGSGELLRKMAGRIKDLREARDEIIVVVSAMGKRTDELISLLNSVTQSNASSEMIDTIASFGERLSANLMTAALQSLNIQARAITPESDYWPVIGRAIETGILAQEKINQSGCAVIDLVKTQARCQQFLEPLIKSGIIPVVCGFLAKDEEGRIITLGRGGSDVSAFLLGRCCRVDEVIIVTDVAGVMKGDPGKVGEQEHLEKITVKELMIMARGGARVIHHDALQYKLPEQKARIVHYESERFDAGGTEITGYVKADVFKNEERLAAITIVGEDFVSIATFGLLNKLTERLARKKISIFGVSLSEQYIGIYIPEEMAEEAYQDLFEVSRIDERFKTISIRKGIGRIKVSSPSFVEEPGVIGRLGDILAMRGINIIEMMTIYTDITIFLEEKDKEKAYNILKEVAI